MSLFASILSADGHLWLVFLDRLGEFMMYGFDRSYDDREAEVVQEGGEKFVCLEALCLS